MAVVVEKEALSGGRGHDETWYQLTISDDLVSPGNPDNCLVTFGKAKADVGDTVTIQLLISDISGLDEYQQLPIPGDMEAKVVEMVKRELSLAPHDNSNDGNDQQ